MTNGTATPLTIYDDVDQLMEDVALLKSQMLLVQSQISSLDPPDDTGWFTLPLAEGVTAYSANAAPQYRRIGNKVYIKGAVKNILEACTIGTLPAGFRPVGTGHSYVQNTSQTQDGAQFARWTIELNGNVTITALSPGASYGADKWFPIHTEFLLD